MIKLIGLISCIFLSVSTFASGPDILVLQPSSICFGHAGSGTKGDWQKCTNTAAKVSLMSNATTRFDADCIDLRYDVEKRLESGCYTSAFSVQTQLIFDTTVPEKIRGICQKSGWLNHNYGKKECLAGTSVYAKDSKKCAIAKAIQLCQEKNLKNCDINKISVRHQYYFFNEPHCVAIGELVVFH